MYEMTIEIDYHFRNIRCTHCSKIIDKRPKYYFDKPNSVLPSSDICKECCYRHRLL